MTNYITYQNLPMMKYHLLKTYGIGNVTSDYLNRIMEIMEQYTYENEYVETQIFCFLKSRAEQYLLEYSVQSGIFVEV